MLESNTDRSWWTIGSIIIGAALIGLAKFYFPELFTDIFDWTKSFLPTQLGSIPTLGLAEFVSSAFPLKH